MMSREGRARVKIRADREQQVTSTDQMTSGSRATGNKHASRDKLIMSSDREADHELGETN